MNWLWTNTFPRRTFTEGTIPTMTCRKNLCGQWLHDWVCYRFMQPKSKSFYCFESSTSLRCWEINAKWQQPSWLQPVVGVCLEQRLYKTVNEMSHGLATLQASHRESIAEISSGAYLCGHLVLHWEVVHCSGKANMQYLLFQQHTTSLHMWFCTNKMPPMPGDGFAVHSQQF